jgi:chorismate mutase
MSIDAKKLKKILDTNHITPLEHFCLDNECAVIKCFFNRNGEFLTIYIPSKYRFAMKPSPSDKIYELEDMDDTTENDDYTKTDRIPDMASIDQDASNHYKELSQKYEKNISIEGNDEPVSRKIKRQIGRLKMPFSRLSYNIAVQNGKWLCMAFDDDLSFFSVKGYQANHKVRNFSFLVVLTDFIEIIDKMSEQITTISDQFYNIIHKASISNFDMIRSEIDSYDTIIQTITSKHGQYMQSIQEYRKLYESMREKEETVINSFRDKINKEQGVGRASAEASLQKQYDILFKSRIEIIERGVDIARRFHRNLLVVEEVSFDNNIMLTLVRKNFDLFKEIL